MNVTLDAGSKSYWFGNNHYAFDSEQKFLDYFFLAMSPRIDDVTHEYIIHGNNSPECAYEQNKTHIFLSVENFPAHRHYYYYNTYGNYGNTNISIYFYNHIDKIEETRSYIAIPVIYCQVTYFAKMYSSIRPSKSVPFQEKKFCIVLSTNGYRSDVKGAIRTFLSTLGSYDTIHEYKPLIENKSCYHSDELLNIIQSYKFAFICENSVADGYVTEKIFNCLFARTIPIYNGSLKIESYINKNNIINANALKNLDSYAEEIRHLSTNEQAFNAKIDAAISTEYNDEGYEKRLKAFMNNNVKVSVIITTYNRFAYVLNAIESVKRQTYPNIEIIVVNDGSTQKEYYEYDFPGVKTIHLEKNSRTIFGFPCAGYVRNQGIQEAKGKYVAFCDDDDIWFPNKIALQMTALEKTGCKISSTDGLLGAGVYVESKTYKVYNAEYYLDTIRKIYLTKGSDLFKNDFPSIWTVDFLRIHNCVITSSVLIEKEVLNTIKNFKNLKNGVEDYDCWLRALEHTDLAYVTDVCFYYDNAHGDGKNY